MRKLVSKTVFRRLPRAAKRAVSIAAMKLSGHRKRSRRVKRYGKYAKRRGSRLPW